MSDFRLSDRARSFRYAGRGLRLVVRGQHNAWIHAAATVVAVGLGIGLGITPLEWCVLLLAIGAVWAAESLNTAIEALADAVAPDPHPKVAAAKDAAAGAVLVCAIAAVGVGGLVFGPRLLAWAGG